MNVQLTDLEIDQFNSLFEKGCELQKSLVILDNAHRNKPGFFGTRKLKKSIQLLKKALEIHPGSWQSMFFICKAFQTLGDLKTALSWFLKVADIEPDNPSVAKEVGLCAGQLGKHDVAIRVMKGPASSHPDDAALQCNIGLSYLLTGKIEEAKT